MTAVAVWDHRPIAAELLAARIAAGWLPTPTATRDGDRVLGYAACVYPAGAGQQLGARGPDGRGK